MGLFILLAIASCSQTNLHLLSDSKGAPVELALLAGPTERANEDVSVPRDRYQEMYRSAVNQQRDLVVCVGCTEEYSERLRATAMASGKLFVSVEDPRFSAGVHLLYPMSGKLYFCSDELREAWLAQAGCPCGPECLCHVSDPAKGPYEVIELPTKAPVPDDIDLAVFKDSKRRRCSEGGCR